MIILNWLPELFLLTLLFVSLILINFRMWSYRSLSIWVAVSAFIELIYLVVRQDLAFFDSPLTILYSDSLSYFGKILSLVTLIVFSLGFHFHRQLNFRGKQSSNLFLIFYSLFTMCLFQSNNLVLFMGAAIGVYLCSTALILIESNQEQSWVRLFRQRALPLAVWIVILSMIFIYGTSLFGSIYFSDWIQTLSKTTVSTLELMVFAFLLILGSVIPLGGLTHLGNAPLGLSVLYYSLFLVLSTFWLRLGVPFFNVSNLLPKATAQILVAVMIGIFSLKSAFQTVRTREHHRWYVAALPTVASLGLFMILLSSEQALPAFYCIAVSMLFTFSLVSHAFLDQEYRNKTTIVFSIIALLGAPPLVLGEQFYRLIHDAVSSGNVTAGVLMFVSWFILSVAATQMIGKILLVKISANARRDIYSSELFFIGTYFVAVIGLTAFRPQLISLLNEHPILNLW